MRELVLSQFTKALLATRGDRQSALSISRSLYGHSNAVVRLLEKAVVTTSDLHADPDFRSAGRAFIELVQVRSLIGKINAISPFRAIPAETRVLAQTERPAAYWTAQGQPKVATHTAFEQKRLDSKKITGLLVLTNELLQGQGAAFESAVSNDLVNPIAALEGITLLDPTNAGGAESPASITHGVAPVPSSGSDADAVRADIRALFAAFDGSLETAVIAMHPETALELSLMQSSLGESSLTVRGGELFGVPVVTSDSVPMDSNGALVALIDPAGILLTDEGVDIHQSNITTIEIYDGQDGTQLLSLWQNNLTSALVERFLNWELARAGSVAWLSGVQWGV
ncbi:phage major capsid protein, HK97 family [Pseudomonas citronellolis]|uniref:Phage major capsid protein, HK97 family n=1 Tax=Pseudomonas citronellolis TaxID=53408 RepID=A0AAQ1HL22_9PSED|nr:phage major capsid protein [Pseudomonas citronellolis]TGC24226.1 phage major capsid protein [Pseudomonas citronellolis]SFC50212.1 phage major capsid protein, HK97 family [Pseudomonas citronellolis]